MQLGCGTQLVKLDLANAYHIVPVYPDTQPLLGIHWQGNTFIDRALPFGLRSSLKIFNAVADLLAWVLHCKGVPHVTHYIDDFLVFETPGSNTVSTARALVESIFRCIGALIAHHQTEGLATMLSFLGIQIDTDRFQRNSPDDKIRRLQNLLQHWNTHKSCTRKDLKSLLGHLSHVGTVIRPSHIFLHTLFSLLSCVSNPCHFVRLNVKARADNACWQCLL